MMRKIIILIITGCFAGIYLSWAFSREGEAAAPKKVVVISVDGSINPASAEYINSGIKYAKIGRAHV